MYYFFYINDNTSMEESNGNTKNDNTVINMVKEEEEKDNIKKQWEDLNKEYTDTITAYFGQGSKGQLHIDLVY